VKASDGDRGGHRVTDRRLLDRITGNLTVGGFRTGALLARAVPSYMAAGMVPPIALGASAANPERRAMVQRHLRRVNPSWPAWRIRQAAQPSFDSYTRYWIESLRLPTLTERAVARGLDVTGYDQVTTGLAAGSGVILALPHLGGWEWAGRWLTDRGHRVTVVVERLDPPELFDWFARLRARLGMTVVPLGPDAGKAILRALGDNDIVCLLCDRDIGGGGADVEFFGERTRLPAGPATLALRTGAPILPVGVYFTARLDGHLGVVRPPIATERHGKLREDVARVTQLLARELEHLIRRAPEQWHLFQPNWPSDREWLDAQGFRGRRRPV
jgi:phosphatidylinositol dimannoside acyltransferase